MTDGLENSSHEFTKAQIKEMITHQQDDYQWKFVFLGANQDAFAEARGLGMDPQNVANFDGDKVYDSYELTSGNIVLARDAVASGQSANSASVSYSDQQREKMT